MESRTRLSVGRLAGFCLLLLLAGCADDIIIEEVPVAQPAAEPTVEEVGLRLAPKGLDLTGLSQGEINRVLRGSYLVNAASVCSACHTTPAGYLAGGREFPLPFPDVQGFTSVFTRNLTPDPETGLALTEAQFVEALRTGKDFTDSTVTDSQALIVMPWHVFRFMSLDDLKTIYAFLRRIPPARNTVRKTFTPPFPFPPVPFPAIGDGDPINDPNNAQRGLLIPQFFTSAANDPNFNNFLSQFDAAVAALTPDERAKVGRGSYLVNAPGDCNTCHTDGAPLGMRDGVFDSGLIPGTFDVNTARYLSGGVNIGIFLGLGDIFSRNLTPHLATGLFLTEEQFIQVLRFGADFRRPGGSLRVEPHFPTEFHQTLDDLKAIYAYLRTIPGVSNPVVITP